MIKNKSRFPRRRMDMKLVIKNRAVFNYGNHWSIESGKRRGFEKLKVKKVKKLKLKRFEIQSNVKCYRIIFHNDIMFEKCMLTITCTYLNPFSPMNSKLTTLGSNKRNWTFEDINPTFIYNIVSHIFVTYTNLYHVLRPFPMVHNFFFLRFTLK